MTTYPTLTKEEFTFFLEADRDFVKRYNLLIPLTGRVRRGLQLLSTYKFYGMFGFAVNRDEALQHYDKACVYDPTIKTWPETTRLMELHRCKCSAV